MPERSRQSLKKTKNPCFWTGVARLIDKEGLQDIIFHINHCIKEAPYEKTFLFKNHPLLRLIYLHTSPYPSDSGRAGAESTDGKDYRRNGCAGGTRRA